MTQFKNKYEHILWDWNGTLLNDVNLCIKTINEILKENDLPVVSRESYRNKVEFPVIEYYRQLGFDFKKTPFEVLGNAFISKYLENWRECMLQNGAKKVLDDFRNQGFKQSVLSATKITLLREGVGYFGLSDYFQELAALNHYYATGKVEIGRSLIKKLGISPSRILMIGDTLHDFKVASDIGADCVLITCGHHPEEKLKETGVPLFDSLLSIPAFLRS